jgi:hypothetical protein
MKTGRLIKFHRPSGDVQAYLFQEGGRYHGLVYLLSDPHSEPIHSEDGANEPTVEAGVRSWIDRHFPKDS